MSFAPKNLARVLALVVEAPFARLCFCSTVRPLVFWAMASALSAASLEMSREKLIEVLVNMLVKKEPASRR